jgi:hypothetical protein
MVVIAVFRPLIIESSWKLLGALLKLEKTVCIVLYAVFIITLWPLFPTVVLFPVKLMLYPP